MSISAKIGCTPQTLNDWGKKAEFDSGKQAGFTHATDRGLDPSFGEALGVTDRQVICIACGYSRYDARSWA